ncbi:uncharacterized protein TNCV_1005601 [Trichonephila clavipes]|uniref:Uncharacterized protein n=1 Tax=Trichonephila clavipes TaxID=2585209 RepID=A0A8X6RC01_TRICX|nr:uncharacterized protein TNCV_1005601 [Trichonephila clavipes]
MASYPNDLKPHSENLNPSLLLSHGALKNCGADETHFQPCLLKHLETELQTDLKHLLQQKVVYQCLLGGREETIEQHRWKVLQQVAEWLNIPNALSMHQDYYVKDQLLQILSKGIKRKKCEKNTSRRI